MYYSFFFFLENLCIVVAVSSFAIEVFQYNDCFVMDHFFWCMSLSLTKPY